jgi:hypothetical protein
MRRFLMAGVIALAATVAMPNAAMAVPFYGQIDYTGTHTTNNPDLTLATQTTINLNFVVINTGAFSVIPLGSSVAHANPVVWSPPGTPYTPLWSHAASGISFNLLSIGVAFASPTQLNLVGSGTFTCTGPCAGYEDTPGNWNMTINTAGTVTGSFSSSSSVPEPGMLALLGLGLVGAARAYRARARK